jgi:hypothetical protein
MASLEEQIENIDQDIANQEIQIEQLVIQRDDLIDTYDENIDRIINPNVTLVDDFIEAKRQELRDVASDPDGRWRTVKQADYNRSIPEWKYFPSTNIPLNQYAVSSLGNIPSEQLDRFSTVGSTSSSWRIEEDVEFDTMNPPDWQLRYDYNNVISDGETAIINANVDYFYAYDLIAQRPQVFDGTYGLVQRINGISRAINILRFDLEKLVDAKTSVTRTIDQEG